MEEIVLLKIIFGAGLTIGGLILLFLSFKFFYKYLIQENRCTAKTKGVVKKYTFGSRGGENSGIHLPVVYYKVNDVEYKVIGPEYRFYTVKKWNSPTITENKTTYEEKDNQRLVVTHNVNSLIGTYKNPMEELYPKDSQIDVYYDPNNPKLSYVLRYCNCKFLFWLMFLAGIFTLLIDICLLLFL